MLGLCHQCAEKRDDKKAEVERIRNAWWIGRNIIIRQKREEQHGDAQKRGVDPCRRQQRVPM